VRFGFAIVALLLIPLRFPEIAFLSFKSFKFLGYFRKLLFFNLIIINIIIIIIIQPIATNIIQ